MPACACGAVRAQIEQLPNGRLEMTGGEEARRRARKYFDLVRQQKGGALSVDLKVRGGGARVEASGRGLMRGASGSQRMDDDDQTIVEVPSTFAAFVSGRSPMLRRLEEVCRARLPPLPIARRAR